MRVPVRSSLEGIEEYKPGKLVKGAIKLSSNENPLGPSPEVTKEIATTLEEGRMKLSVYPWEKNETELRYAISRYLGTTVEKVVLGAGVDGVLDTLVKIFIDKGEEAIIPIPTFSLYESLVKIAGGVPRYAARKRSENFSVLVEEVIGSGKPRMIFICSPNNPTGNCIPEDDIRAIIESVHAMVIIDEAYVEFADSSLKQLMNEYENVAVVRTFSKAFGLAALRVGYGIIPEWLVDDYKKVAIPFSVNSIALRAAITALRDKEHLSRSVEVVKQGRSFLEENLQQFFTVYPSQANFVLVDVAPMKSYEVCDSLEKHGITVRDCSSFRGAGDTLIRISVGTEEQNKNVVAVLKSMY
jgi:histidinol-phosphate aminotransferase